MNSYEGEAGYLQLLQDTLTNGELKQSRNGNVYSRFGIMITFKNIDNEFPLLTSKKMFFRGIVEELLWFLKGSTNAKKLQEKNVHIWDGNSSREYLDSIGLNHYEIGELGPIYGWQWRNFNRPYKTTFGGTDQIKYIIEELIKPNNSRRAVLSAWNPEQLNEMALPPCHMVYTFYKDKNGLSCLMNMRSSDLFLGLPFNIASTALLLSIIAHLLDIKPNTISVVIADAHIYEEHINAVKSQIDNKFYNLPQIKITKDLPIFTIEEKLNFINSLEYSDIKLENYISSPSITAKML